MSDFTPVEGQKGLYRDNNTTAIINKDKSGYNVWNHLYRYNNSATLSYINAAIIVVYVLYNQT